MPVKFEDYYKTLGVPRDASADDIKRAYRKLAHKYHPDRNQDPEAATTFSKVSEAYEVLRDPDKRSKYDRLGKDWKAGQDFRPPPGWEGGQFHAGPGGQQFNFHSAGDFSDFFEMLFGQAARGGRRPGTPGSGSSQFEQMFHGAGHAGGSGGRTSGGQVHEITVSLHEAFHGGARSLRLQSPQGEQTLEVKIPKGVTSGAKIRLKQHGLLLKINVAKDPRFELDGRNLIAEAKVTPWDAALGVKVDVETMDGAVTMAIPPGTSSGQKLRLKGKGLPASGKKEAGDLFVRVMIQTPKPLTDEQKDLFEKLRQSAEED